MLPNEDTIQRLKTKLQEAGLCEDKQSCALGDQCKALLYEKIMSSVKNARLAGTLIKEIAGWLGPRYWMVTSLCKMLPTVSLPAIGTCSIRT